MAILITRLIFQDSRGVSEGSFSAREMIEDFSAKEREALTAGQVLVRPGGMRIVSATALAMLILSNPAVNLIAAPDLMAAAERGLLGMRATWLDMGGTESLFESTALVRFMRAAVAKAKL